jgi:quinol monooxygenase YgiN
VEAIFMAEVKLALLARVEAKAGKEAEVENFLRSALSIVEDEPQTVEWFALKMGPSTFGIFDVFENEEGRQAHLNGRVAAGLMANAAALLAKAPVIENVEVLAVKTGKR